MLYSFSKWRLHLVLLLPPFGFKAVLYHPQAELSSSASAAASDRVNELLKEAFPEERAAMKGKGKRIQKKDVNPVSSKAAKN